MISMEQIVQMGPMLVLAGLMMGWLAETAWRAGGYGLLADIVVGLAGSVLGGVAFWVAISSQIGMVAMVVIGSVGGGLAIAVQRVLSRWMRSPGIDLVASDAPGRS
jgi:uncharacterized membrane protein YeaQ/YmgE (transglycosylase-associated protein family)